MLVRPGELEAHEHGLDAARDEKGEGGHEVHDADLFVIDRGEPAAEPWLRLPHRMQFGFERRVVLGDLREAFVLGNGEHLLLSQSAERNTIFKRDHRDWLPRSEISYPL